MDEIQGTNHEGAPDKGCEPGQKAKEKKGSKRHFENDDSGGNCGGNSEAGISGH